MICCPRCGSDAVIILAADNLQVCKDCEHSWAMESPPLKPRSQVSLSESDSTAARTFCKDLARSAQWVREVEEQWPAPIAHEVHRLREILEEGRIVSAVLQLRDVAEVLIKFPCLVMARWVQQASRTRT